MSTPHGSPDAPTGPRVLVIGATGKTGRRVAHLLTERGVPVRVGSRSATPAFDWGREEGWDACLGGVRAAYITYTPDLAVPGATDAIAAFGAGTRLLSFVFLPTLGISMSMMIMVGQNHGAGQRERVRTITLTALRFAMILVAVLALISIVGLFGVWGYQIMTGMGVAGIRRPVFWGMYIVNFVFWIGISHSGTFV